MFNFLKKDRPKELNVDDTLIEKKIEVSITFTGDIVRIWTISQLCNSKDLVFKEFYKWYFTDLNSRYFNFRTFDINTFIDREQIVLVEIKKCSI